MRILSIETSCDETAVAVLSCMGDEKNAEFEILANALISQIDVHRPYGGVFPALAKREHAKNLVPLLIAVLEQSQMLFDKNQIVTETIQKEIESLLSKDAGMFEIFMKAISTIDIPKIDAIAVTYGPGLAPALWVGVNFARALSYLWNKPLIAINHMEGHFLSALAEEQTSASTAFSRYKIQATKFPILGLLISGGHTELLLMKKWLSYELIGQTRDDAVGEAYDKVARMLSLPYPGGPEISRLADFARERHSKNFSKNPFILPRPMISDATFDFSFSGLKTAVLYLVKDLTKVESSEKSELSQIQKEDISLAFEDACAEVLVSKTMKALIQTGSKTLTIGGGVSANKNIKESFKAALRDSGDRVVLSIPSPVLSGDNAIMIGIAGYYRALRNEFSDPSKLIANGNLSLYS
jgi:N6-L-threonylcarbamoyladenine synthase